MLTEEQIGILIELSHEIRRGLVDLYDFEFFDNEFCGACAVASWLLREKAREHGIELTLAVHSEHCWLVDFEGMVVDPTYSQFAWPDEDCDILIGCPTEAHEASGTFFEDDVVLYGEEAEEFLMEWPEDQNPLSSYQQPNLRKFLAA